MRVMTQTNGFIPIGIKLMKIIKLGSNRVLEIGIGNGLVSKYLKGRKITVMTLNIDEKLNSDIAGSVL